jgi:hypothetical protein
MSAVRFRPAGIARPCSHCTTAAGLTPTRRATATWDSARRTLSFRMRPGDSRAARASSSDIPGWNPRAAVDSAHRAATSRSAAI